MLLAGAERLRASQNELARNRTTPDFHIELLRLRQNWRLKKVSNSIIGDLSYRTGTVCPVTLYYIPKILVFLFSLSFSYRLDLSVYREDFVELRLYRNTMEQNSC